MYVFDHAKMRGFIENALQSHSFSKIHQSMQSTKTALESISKQERANFWDWARPYLTLDETLFSEEDRLSIPLFLIDEFIGITHVLEKESLSPLGIMMVNGEWVE